MDNISPESTASAIAEPRRKISCLLVAGLALILIVVLGVATWFWFNRPIKPVELTQQETEVLQDKIETIEELTYEEGSKEIVLSERELNGLINQNTNLGEKLKLTLANDEIHARIETDLDEDLPVVGGKKLKARAKFTVDSIDGKPSLVLDDFTVWGASLPNDWLGGMKGKDLLGEIFGNGAGIGGIEELRIERGQLVIKLAE
ncbi:hypothetical protein ACFSSA_14765 [Luteolibacter algae]|uniref:Uncharacterized protein n=1 Tax=Luteolibacter algae TaxID=454151 RepID=A0ABW5DD31_9BACT